MEGTWLVGAGEVRLAVGMCCVNQGAVIVSGGSAFST